MSYVNAMLLSSRIFSRPRLEADSSHALRTCGVRLWVPVSRRMSESPSVIQVCIAGTGSYLPEKILTNAELAAKVDTSDEWIVSRTGIKERRIAAEGERTSDMATAAARNAMTQAGLAAEDIELIIVATITPDTLTPATACYVQKNLGAYRAVAFDISAACSGFLYAMKIAKRLIASGAFKNALIIGAEKLSAVTNWEDRTTCVLFGDGAGAAVLRIAAPEEGDILATEMGTDGNLTHLLNIPGGGTACPITRANIDDHLFALTMMGKEVFKHAVNRMKEAAEKVIDRAGLKPEDIACVIPHQANLRIIDAIADRLAVPNDRVFVNLDKYGNTSAAAVAIALDEAHRSGAFKRGDHIVLVVFGAGLTWAAAAIRW
jgi:3-oxoacyl-[acyl-carrier-protein] synthase III